LLKRYQEHQYFVRGINPNHVYELRRGYPDAPVVSVDPNIQVALGGGGYPPWSYFTGLFLAPPIHWPTTKTYFAFLNLLALGIMVAFAYSVMIPHGRLPAISLATSVLAMGGNGFALGAAQYGLIVNALLIGMVFFLKAEWYTAAGLLYGLALLKPSMAAPFFFILVARNCWSGILVANVYVLAATMIVWGVVGTDPLTMLMQMFDVSRSGGYTMIEPLWPVTLTPLLGVPEQTLLILTALVGLAITSLVIWLFKNSGLTVLLAVASVLSCLWTVHRAYDDMIVMFLLVALGQLAIKNFSTPTAAMFLLVGASLWLPPRISDLEYVGYVKLLIWLCCLGYLLKAYLIAVKSRACTAGQSAVGKLKMAN
jgi:hypothetical protein